MARLIDADALREKVVPYTLEKGCILGRHSGKADAVLELIDNAPTIDAEPVRHGTWKTKPNPQWPAHNEQHCSACGWHIHKSKLRNSDKWAYCPNCGAKMEGE